LPCDLGKKCAGSSRIFCSQLWIAGKIDEEEETMANPNNPNQPKRPQSSQSGTGESYRLRCADVGNKECPWETRGATPEEVLRSAEQHGREQHNMTSMDENTRDQVMSKIQRAA
jgi:predicted small metal-binding protein